MQKQVATFTNYTIKHNFMVTLLSFLLILIPSFSYAQSKLSSNRLSDLRIVTEAGENYLRQSGDYLIKKVNVMVGNGEQYEAIDVHLKNGIIDDISYNQRPRGNTVVIEAEGKWLTPGLINFVEVPLNIDRKIDSENIPYIIDYLSSKDGYFETALRAGVTGIHLIDSTAKMQIGTTLFTVVQNNVYEQVIPNQRSVFHYRCDEQEQRNDATSIQALSKTEYFAAIIHKEMPFILHCNSSGRLSYSLDLLKKIKLPVAGIIGIESYKLANTIDSSICLFGSGLIEETHLDSSRMTPIISFTRNNFKGCTIVHTKNIGNMPYFHAILGKISASAQLVRRIANQGGLKISNTINWVTGTPAKLLRFDRFSGQIGVGMSGDAVLWSSSPDKANALVDSVFIKSQLVFSENKLLSAPDALIGRKLTTN